MRAVTREQMGAPRARADTAAGQRTHLLSRPLRRLLEDMAQLSAAMCCAAELLLGARRLPSARAREERGWERWCSTNLGVVERGPDETEAHQRSARRHRLQQRDQDALWLRGPAHDDDRVLAREASHVVYALAGQLDLPRAREGTRGHARVNIGV
jgi:hypothetical protein